MGLNSGTHRIAGKLDTNTGTPVIIDGASPPSNGQVLTATGPTVAGWATPTTGAPLGAQYLTLANDSTLTNERLFTPGTGLSGTDGGANSTYTLAINQAASLTWTGTQSFQDTKFKIVDVSDATKVLMFDIAGTTGLTSTIAWAPTSGRTATIPDATDTFVMLATAQTITNKTIDDTTNIVRATKLATSGSPVVINSASPPTTGQVLTATGATAASWQTPTTMNASGGFNWVTVTASSQAISAGTVYIANGSALQTFTLPVTANVGDTFQIVGKSTNLFKVAQNSGQVIHFGDQDSTTGVSGSWQSQTRYDTIEISCVVANTDWQVMDSDGIFTRA